MSPLDPQAAAMRLTLDDGSDLVGRGSGALTAVSGEVVFNTAMMGYPESLTDPSYAGQILVLTYPLVGNYGIPEAVRRPGSGDAAAEDRDVFQSGRVQVEGLVVHRLSGHFSHHAAARSLESWLGSQGVPILSEVDTRALTRRLRERGTMRGWLHPDSMSREEALKCARPLDMRREAFLRVAPSEVLRHEGPGPCVLLVDVGAKDGILECLRRRGASVVRAPWHANLRDLARSAEGIVIGNGPGDPSDLPALAEQVRGLFETFRGPIFGICLGHQVLARAAGFKTYRLPYGHRGVNQPVQDVRTGRCYVTSQNHGYAVDLRGGPGGWEPWFRNLNDATNEGLRSRTRPHFGVQFHPEGRPGPLDTEFLFDEFLSLCAETRAAVSA